MSVYSIFDQFKSSYELFDFWMELIQKGPVFFPEPFWEERIMKWQTQWGVIWIYLKKKRKNEWEENLWKKRILLDEKRYDGKVLKAF